MPTPGRKAPIRRETCRYCHRSIIRGLLQNGRYRSMEPTPVAPASLSPGDAFGFSRGLGVFIDMVGVKRLPVDVLAAHHCAEYGDAKILGRMQRLDDIDVVKEVQR
jgi:hypothetical protein